MSEVVYEKLYNDPNIDKFIQSAGEKYNDNMEGMIGVGLNMPFENVNSAARKNMFASQYQQKVCLIEPEKPHLSTGYENIFGQHSSAFRKADRNWTVLARIEKYESRPGHHYYLIVVDEQNNMDIIERVSYCHNTETYGFLYDNSQLDCHGVGSVIPEGTTIKKSISFDDADNYMPGKNLLVTYIADASTTEDAIEISRSAAYKLRRPEIKVLTILINDNDIPLNLYGDNNTYKLLPDIGEEVNGGILCGTRTERNDESFFTQSVERLKQVMINDTTFKSEGTVVDITVYCNKDINCSNNGIYEGQLAYYAQDFKRFCKEFTDVMYRYMQNTDYHKSYDLEKMYKYCQDVLSGKQYFKDNIFSNIVLEVVLFKESPVAEGDKITSRHGGKGVVSRVIDDELMPLIHGTDKRLDLIWNQSTCVNRENLGQLNEVSINFIGENIVKFIKQSSLDAIGCADVIHEFYEQLSPTFADFFAEVVTQDSHFGVDSMMDGIMSFFTEDGDGLYVSLEPISESVTFNDLVNLYKKYPEIAPVFIDVPIVGSRGQIRYVCSQKPSIVAKQYIYRMKQNAEEKHSATSLSATNVRNLNSKSKASKMYIRIHPNTPIRFGEMEGNILRSMGAEIDAMNMMLYSNSPVGRRDAKQMLTSYTFNVQLSEDAKSRSAEILNAIIKAMGYEFVFKKILIKYGDPFQACFDDPKLFYFCDPAKDPLFVRVDEITNKLFTNVSEQERKLFINVSEAVNKLFCPCNNNEGE